MALRVLPSLSRAVTTADVRRRKRLVMLLPGLVAFGFYRLAKPVIPLSDISILLVFSGLIGAVTALVAYTAGRRVSLLALFRDDGIGWLGWIGGWIGFVYAVQLSLMVLALLKLVVQYDYLQHPDGPAMMAVIIACTSIARDAFELGHLRRLQHAAEPIITFPDGSGLRAWLTSNPIAVRTALVAGFLTVLTAWVASMLSSVGASALGQLLIVTTVAGTLALAAYLLSVRPDLTWRRSVDEYPWLDLFRFWWWPGLAFAATYYLTLQGLVMFVIGTDLLSGAVQAVLAASVGAGMALYCAYLGQRRAIEDRIHHTVPSSLLRCPFVLDILSRRAAGPSESLTSPAAAAVGEGRRS